MKISEAESIVMTELWQLGEATAEDLVAALATPNDWQEPTIKTLINRLLNKGAIAAEREGRRYRYRPLLKQQDWVLDESRSLIDRLFGGRVAPLVAQFSERGTLSRSDIAELRQLIDRLDDHASDADER
jgi:BlaI family transcriptional regulator, penicillinase repressor